MIHTNAIKQTYDIRNETLDGREYIVAPVVMMKTGVHHGSAGPIFHDIAELGAIPESWNGIPVTIGHPQDGDRNISANSPDQHEKSVGKIFNTHVDGDKLRAEAWLDVQKLTATSPEALEYITQKKQLDVSVGVFTEDLVMAGTYGDEKYEAVARAYRPDHLALLPGEQGACSWQDGCGIRANAAPSGEEKPKVEPQGDAKAEKPQIKHSINLNSKAMADEKTPCCIEKINALISNERTRFTEKDREWLEGVAEPMLNKLEPTKEKPAPQVNTDKVIADYKATLKTPEDYLALMPDSMKAQMQEGLRLYTDKRDQQVKHIMDNTGETWSEDELKAMPDLQLEKLTKSVKAPADYSAMKTNKEEPKITEHDVLLPMGVELNS